MGKIIAEFGGFGQKLILFSRMNTDDISYSKWQEAELHRLIGRRRGVGWTMGT